MHPEGAGEPPEHCRGCKLHQEQTVSAHRSDMVASAIYAIAFLLSAALSQKVHFIQSSL